MLTTNVVQTTGMAIIRTAEELAAEALLSRDPLALVLGSCRISTYQEDEAARVSARSVDGLG